MPGQEASRESGFWLATTAATPLLRWATSILMVGLFAIFLFAAVYANLPLARSDGFIPFIQATMFITELVTAILLFTQFAILREPAILVLASGYLFTSLIVVAHTLSFPGALSPTGLLGEGLQTTGWLHIIWHFMFPATVLAYALLKDRDANRSVMSNSLSRSLILVCMMAVVALVLIITFGLMAADARLPRLFLNRTTFAPLAGRLGLLDTLICVAAFAVLFVRQRSFLDRWVLVATFATLLEMAMVIMIAGRFTLGWYAVRLFGVTASVAVLVALLVETMVLYARLASAMILVKRERSHRMMSLDAATSAMAHELRQPLAAIEAAGSAALNWLKKTPPDIEEAKACLDSSGRSVQRVADAISSVRELFKRTSNQRTMIHINEIAVQALSAFRGGLDSNQIAITNDLQADLPEVHADRTQVQQVVLNLIKNGIEAMRAGPSDRKHLTITTRIYGHSSVLLSVQDTGPGIDPHQSDRIFEPFFTTKVSGMGLGLAICRSIVEDHGGSLRLTKADSEGCIFEFVLPIVSVTPGGIAVPPE